MATEFTFASGSGWTANTVSPGNLVTAGYLNKGKIKVVFDMSTKISNLNYSGDTWGKFIPITWGLTRVQGYCVFASPFREMQNVRSYKRLSSSGRPKFQTTYGYNYHVDVGYSFGMSGNPARRRYMNRLYLNNTIVYDRVTGYRYPGVTFQFHDGNLDEMPDSRYVLFHGEYAVPFRGQMYVMMQNLPVETFGTALPIAIAEIYDDPATPVVADDFINNYTPDIAHTSFAGIDWIRRKMYVRVKGSEEENVGTSIAAYDLDTLEQIGEYPVINTAEGTPYAYPSSDNAWAYIPWLNAFATSGTGGITFGTNFNSIYIIDAATGLVVGSDGVNGSTNDPENGVYDRFLYAAITPGRDPVSVYFAMGTFGFTSDLNVIAINNAGQIIAPKFKYVPVSPATGIGFIAGDTETPAFYFHEKGTNKIRRVVLINAPTYEDFVQLPVSVPAITIPYMFAWNDGLFVLSYNGTVHTWTRYDTVTREVIWNNENVAAPISFNVGKQNQTNFEGGTYAYGTLAGTTTVLNLHTGQVETLPIIMPQDIWDSETNAFYTTRPVYPPYRSYIRNPNIGKLRLDNWLRDICVLGGMSLSELQFIGINDEIEGAFLSQSYDLEQLLTDVCALFRISKTEVDGKLRFEKKFPESGEVIPELTIDYSELTWVNNDEESKSAIGMKRSAEVSQPGTVSVAFINPDTGYTDDMYSWKRPKVSTQSAFDVNYTIPLVMQKSQVARLTQELMFDLWGKRTLANIRLPTKRYNIDPGTIIQLTHSGFTDLVSVTETTHEGDWSVSCAIELIRSRVGSVIQIDDYIPSPIPRQGRPESELYFFDVPALISDHDIPDRISYYVSMGGVGQPYWPGGYISQANESGPFSTLATFNTSDVIDAGRARNVIDALPGSTSDGLRIFFGVNFNPFSDRPERTTQELLDDPTLNVAFYGLNGRWEIIQWGKATLDAQGTVTFDNVIRGKRGTDATIAQHIVGDRFIPVDSNVKWVNSPVSIYATVQQFKAVGYGQPLESAITHVFEIVAAGKKPWAPTLRALAPLSGSDALISWFRRDRNGFSTLGTATPLPMSETTEAYDLELLNDAGAVVRTVAGLATPSYTYTAAQQATDGLPGPFGTIRARVYQLSAVTGRGSPGEGLIYVR